MLKIEAVTEWNKPAARIDTGSGNTTYRIWCEREVSRINAKPGHTVFLQTAPDGRVRVAQKKE